MVQDRNNRRADIVVFVNGLPLTVLELKDAASKDADIWQAFRQPATYKDQIPSLFAYNGVLVISDGLEARIGTSNHYRFVACSNQFGNREQMLNREEDRLARLDDDQFPAALLGLE